MKQVEKESIENEIRNMIGNLLTNDIDLGRYTDHSPPGMSYVEYYKLKLDIGRKIRFYKVSTYIIYFLHGRHDADKLVVYVYNTINKSTDIIYIVLRNISFELKFSDQCLVDDYYKEMASCIPYCNREVYIGRSNNVYYSKVLCIIDEYAGNQSIELPDEIIDIYGSPPNRYLMESEIVYMFINKSFRFHHKKDDIMFKYTCDDMIEYD